MRNILIIEDGGRGHALTWRCRQDYPEADIRCIPGNAGMSMVGKSVTHIQKPTDIKDIVEYAKAFNPGLTIVGPEAPIIAGIADRFLSAGLPILAPSGETAYLTEGSKVEFYNFLDRNSLPAPQSRAFAHDEWEEALAWAEWLGGGGNIVLKADGLCGGKGVYLPRDSNQAALQYERLYKKFGKNAERILVQERVEGEEFSAIGITDGKNVIPLPFTRDYKRVGDGDRGPNTGGMGAHTLKIDEKTEREATELLAKVVEALRNEDTPYKGFIYLGLMLTDEGFKILECNCRDGSPETQVQMVSTGGNFVDLAYAAAMGDLDGYQALPQVCEALTVMLTSDEYPESSDVDVCLSGIHEAEQLGALVFHGSTYRLGTSYTTNRGGRIIESVGRGDTLAEAHKIAYAGARAISYEDGRPLKYRSDIGASLLVPA